MGLAGEGTEGFRVGFGYKLRLGEPPEDTVEALKRRLELHGDYGVVCGRYGASVSCKSWIGSLNADRAAPSILG